MFLFGRNISPLWNDQDFSSTDVVNWGLIQLSTHTNYWNTRTHTYRQNGGRCCARNCMLRGTETWLMKKQQEMTLQWSQTKIIRWMCGVILTDRFTCNEFRQKLQTIYIITVIQQKMFRRYGHVSRKDENDLVKQDAQLSQKDRETRYVSWNLVNCWKTVQNILKKVGIREWAWRSLKWHWKSLKVIRIAAIWQAMITSY